MHFNLGFQIGANFELQVSLLVNFVLVDFNLDDFVSREVNIFVVGVDDRHFLTCPTFPVNDLETLVCASLISLGLLRFKRFCLLRIACDFIFDRLAGRQFYFAGQLNFIGLHRVRHLLFVCLA